MVSVVKGTCVNTSSVNSIFMNQTLAKILSHSTHIPKLSVSYFCIQLERAPLEVSLVGGKRGVSLLLFVCVCLVHVCVCAMCVCACAYMCV